MANQIAVIRATLKYSTQEELIQGMKPLISKRGLFIHTRTTRPEGSQVRFELTLADGSQVYSGEGVVRKEIPFVGGPSSQKSGMLIALRRINRPFKAVVDAILAQETANTAEPPRNETDNSTAPEPHATGKKQFIVQSRSGEPQGFDLFGDMDFDEGLDSLFSGIAKKPAQTTSGIFSHPTVVSGIHAAPNEQEDIVEFHDTASTPDAPTVQMPSLSNDLNERCADNGNARPDAVTGSYQTAPAPNTIGYPDDWQNALQQNIQNAEMLRDDTPVEIPAVNSDNAMPVTQNDQTVEMAPSIEQNIPTQTENDQREQQTTVPQTASTPDPAQQTASVESFFPHSETEATPSELFAALHDDILSNADNPAAPATNPIQQDTAVQTSSDNAPQNAPTTIPNSAETPAIPRGVTPPQSTLSLNEILGRTTAEPNHSNLSLENVIKHADAKQKDIIMTDVTSQGVTPRRRTVNIDENTPNTPPPKKSGFFSNLFKH